MQRFTVIGDNGSRDLNGDFRSLGSSGVFEALPGSRYGSSIDLTETGARPRTLPRALQPKTAAKDPQQRSSSYRLPVVALPPPRAPVTRGGLASSSAESAEGFRSQGYGNHGDRSLGNRLQGGNQNFGSHVLLASRPDSVQNQSAFTGRRNSESIFGHVTTPATPGTAQADAQAQWIERVMKGGGYHQPRGAAEAERENRTERNADVGYRSVPLSSFRNRRNSSSDLDPMSKSSAQNAYVTSSKATISLAMPRSTRYGSLFDLSRDGGPNTGGEDGGGGRQTGSDVIGDGFFPRSSSGIRRNGTSGLSKEQDEEPVFGSSSFSSSSNVREYRNPDASGSGGHVTGRTWNRRFDAVGRSPGTPVVVKRLENWNKTEKTTPGDVTRTAIKDDRLTYDSGSPSSLAFRSRKFSFDQTLPQKQNDFRSFTTSKGPAMTSSGGPPKPSEAKGPSPAGPWGARASAVSGPFRERSQSTTLSSRCPRGGSSGADLLDSSTALLALRSSRYPSAQPTDGGDGDATTMSASERIASSPWTARAAAPSDSGEKSHNHHHHHHHHQRHLHQSLGQWVPSTNSPGSSVSSNFEEVDDVINGRQYSSVSCAPVTSEATKDRFRSTAPPPPAHDVISYSTAPSHIASSSLCDVSGEDSSIYSASENGVAQRQKDEASPDLGDMAARKSSSPTPLPSFTWQIPRRNSLPVVSLERKEPPTTKTGEGGRGGRGGGNYESIFSKGDWINAARMTWKSPSRTGSPVTGNPASFSTDRRAGSFHDDWKTPSESESSSSVNRMTSALPAENSKTFEISGKAGESVKSSGNSRHLHGSGADSRSDSTVSRERVVASGIPESSREWPGAIFRDKSTTEEQSLASSDRGEALSRSDSKTTDWMESQKNTVPVEDSRIQLERTNPEHDSRRIPEEDRRSDIIVTRSTKSSGFTENDVNSTALASEQSVMPFNLRDTSIIARHGVESDVGSRSPASREPTRTRHLNFKEWYYSGLERTGSTTDADQSYCATQVSDHESGYQSSGPTLDDLPLKEPNMAGRNAVHREQIRSEDPEYSARIFRNGCDSDAENKDGFISANRFSSVVEKTSENGNDGSGRCDVPVADSSGSGRNPESGGPRELEIHVRASPLGVGFSIEGGQGSTSGDRPITVKKIFTGGDHLSDKLKPGDAIVRVNDKDFTRMTHYEAWNYLKTLPEGPATFLVHTN